MNIRISFVLAVLALLLVSCRPVPQANALIVIDRSGSVRGIDTAAVGVADRCARLPGLGRKSSLTVLATGTPQTAGEPILLATFPLFKQHNAMEGPSATDENAELLQRVAEMSAGIANGAPITPLHLALLRGVAQLKAAGCGSPPDAARCRLVVITDGEETEEPAIRKALKSKAEFKPPGSLMIDNAGIDVDFCGLAQTTGNTPPRSAVRAARLESVWRGVFSEPAAVSFEPFCPERQPEGEHGRP